MFALSVTSSPIQAYAFDGATIAIYAIVLLLCAIAATRRPAFAVAAMIALDPFALYSYVGLTTTLTLPKMALLGTFAGLIVRRASPGALQDPRARPLLIGALLIVGATALSIAQAEYPSEAVRQTFKALEYAATFLVVLVAMREDPGERPIRIALALVAAVVSLAAISQEFGGAPSALRYANHLIPRVAGPLEGPNQLSGYLGVTLPLIAAFALLRKPLWGELPVLALGTFALLLTYSRAGAIASLLAVGLVIALAPAARRRAVTIVVGIAAVAGLGGLAVSARSLDILWHFSAVSNSDDPGSVGNRSQLWHAAIALWRAHPWLGIGAGNFELEIGKVGPHGIKTHANSLYLQSLVEGGLPLLGAQLYTTAVSITTFAQSSLREPFVLGALGASASLAVHQIVDLLVFYPKVGVMWWIVLALGASRAGTRNAACPER